MRLIGGVAAHGLIGAIARQHTANALGVDVLEHFPAGQHGGIGKGLIEVLGHLVQCCGQLVGGKGNGVVAQVQMLGGGGEACCSENPGA